MNGHGSAQVGVGAVQANHRLANRPYGIGKMRSGFGCWDGANA